MFTKKRKQKERKDWIWTVHQRKEKYYQSGTVRSILAEKR
nr:MAG TPA_asm: hypothetical protein [Caudoviricetes sp.]